jgi:hypothetical protein
MNRIFSIFFCVFLFGIFNCSGQDTTNAKPVFHEGYKQWTKYRSSLRLGLGIQSSFYSEIGFSLHKYYYNDLAFASSAFYTALEWIPSRENIYGLKVGYELNIRTAVAIEIKYLTNNETHDFFITPKAGFGVLGILTLFYGYNFSLNQYQFTSIGYHQFSITANLNRHNNHLIKSGFKP